jgi:hypothetical protein
MPPEDLITQPGADPANPGAAGADPANPNPGADPAKPADPPKNWYPDDWRKHYSGGDEKLGKRLERFTTPDGVLKSWLAAEQKITSGEYKRSAKPENASPEQLAQWRLESGIPDKAEAYDIKIDEKLMVDGDKEYLDGLYKYAHEKDLPKSHVEHMVNYLFTNRKAQADAMAVQDKEDATTVEETLRVAFGADYLPNMNIMSGMFDGLAEGTKDQLLGARLADGTMIKNNPDMVKALVQLAREANPAGTLVPSHGGANTAQSVGEEIAKIEKFMKTNNTEYHADKAMQARYLQLLDAQSKLKNKAA